MKSWSCLSDAQLVEDQRQALWHLPRCLFLGIYMTSSYQSTFALQSNSMMQLIGPCIMKVPLLCCPEVSVTIIFVHTSSKGPSCRCIPDVDRAGDNLMTIIVLSLRHSSQQKCFVKVSSSLYKVPCGNQAVRITSI